LIKFDARDLHFAPQKWPDSWSNDQRIERDKGSYRKPRVVKNRSSLQPSPDASKHRDLGFLHADFTLKMRFKLCNNSGLELLRVDQEGNRCQSGKDQD
jgi:hypothetical protein